MNEIEGNVELELEQIRDLLMEDVCEVPIPAYYRAAMETAYESLCDVLQSSDDAKRHLADLGDEAVQELKSARTGRHREYRTVGGMEIHYVGLNRFSFDLSIEFPADIAEGSVHAWFGWIIDQVYIECRRLQGQGVGNYLMIEKHLNAVVWEALGNKKGAFAIESHGVEFQGIEAIVIPTEREMVEDEFIHDDGAMAVATGWL